jgi:hypothetical protein
MIGTSRFDRMDEKPTSIIYGPFYGTELVLLAMNPTDRIGLLNLKKFHFRHVIGSVLIIIENISG